MFSSGDHLDLDFSLFVDTYFSRELVLSKCADHSEESSLYFIADIVGYFNEVMDGNIEENIRRKDPILILVRKIDVLE
jgi:hypothetical protein